MADKKYLDSAGLERLKQYIDNQYLSLQKAVDLLNDQNGTPGSIQEMIDNAINVLSIDDLQQKGPVIIYGGSASDLIEEA